MARTRNSQIVVCFLIKFIVDYKGCYIQLVTHIFEVLSLLILKAPEYLYYKDV